MSNGVFAGEPVQPPMQPPVQPYELPKPIEVYPIANLSDIVLPPTPEELVAAEAVAAIKAEIAPVKAEATKTDAPKHKPSVKFLECDTNRKVITLIAPVSIEGSDYEKLTVWRPTAAQIESWINGASATSYDLYNLMCGLEIGTIEQLFGDDTKAIVEAGYGFLPQSLRQETQSSAI